MAERKKLSIREKADYLPAFLSIGSTAITAPVTGPFRGPQGADTYKHHVTYAIIRKFNSRLSSLQSQCFQPSFEGLYEKRCKSCKINPDVVATPAGVRGFWVGDKEKAKYVMIYYHGGGFALPGSEGHLNFWQSVQDDLAASNISTAFFFVLYTLTPHAVYPTQLREAVSAVRYVVEELHRPPSEVMLLGDSAGGNLAVSVLLHLTKPNPEIESLTLKENLKGLVLMAPWVSFDTTIPSFELNKHRDYLEADVEGRWSMEYLAGHAHDPYTDPVMAPSDWWKDAKADRVFVTIGSSEALLDGILKWVDNYQNSNPNIQLVIGQNEVHIAPIIWPMFGDKRETEQGKAIKTWLREYLSA